VRRPGVPLISHSALSRYVGAAALSRYVGAALLLGQAAVRRLKPIGDFVHTITFDNGKEFAAHQDIAHALKAKIFFATPYHAWERGLNENTNGLIRDFFPKGTDFATIANAQVAKVERLLNASGPGGRSWRSWRIRSRVSRWRQLTSSLARDKVCWADNNDPYCILDREVYHEEQSGREQFCSQSRSQ